MLFLLPIINIIFGRLFLASTACFLPVPNYSVCIFFLLYIIKQVDRIGNLPLNIRYLFSPGHILNQFLLEFLVNTLSTPGGANVTSTLPPPSFFLSKKKRNVGKLVAFFVKLLVIAGHEEFPTLLHFAARFGLEKLSLLLMECPGGEQACQLRNASDFSPPDLADQNGHTRLANMMRGYMVRAFFYFFLYRELMIFVNAICILF